MLFEQSLELIKLAKEDKPCCKCAQTTPAT